MENIEIPMEIDDATVAFPASVSHLMPKWEEIPEEFKDGNNKFSQIQSKWFFKGLDKNILIPKKDIDKEKAMRHLVAIQGSYEPKHEHKMAAVAYLMSKWFTIKEG